MLFFPLPGRILPRVSSFPTAVGVPKQGDGVPEQHDPLVWGGGAPLSLQGMREISPVGTSGFDCLVSG